MKKAFFFIILLLSFSLSSCDPIFFRITIDGGFEKSFNFECGKADVSCGTLADKELAAGFRLKLDSPILIVPEELKITHNNIPLEPSIRFEERFRSFPIREQRIIDNDGALIISVKSNHQNRFRVGDTVTINIDNFIVCKEKPLEIGDINMIFVNRK